MAHSSGSGGGDDRSDGPSCGDPYQVLGLGPGASDDAVSKAYKKLALLYHPDKLRSQRDDHDDAAKQKAVAEKRFHDITEARNFLLNPEFRDSRRNYDARMRSRRARQAEDERRERDMSDRRRRMRDELAAKEGRAARKRRADFADARSSAADGEDDDERLERLRREGRAMRERYDEASARRTSRDRAAARDALENRQVRLKWSRRRTTVSHSDDSIFRLMKAFGEVEDVKMIGDKGNAALVTFRDAGSCGPCVEAYLDSDEMRASFVGKRKEEEIMNQRRQTSSSSSYHASPADGGVGRRAAENLDERRARQAAEREALRRRMEMEDRQGGNVGLTTAASPDDDAGMTPGAYDHSTQANGDVFGAAAQRRSGVGTVPPTYPPPFPPPEDEALGLTPLQSLEKLERIVLPKCTSLSAK